MSKWWMRGDASHIMDKPWLSPLVIEHLEGLLTPDMKVCEHGSGGSTIWLSSRVAKVTAYEVNPEWYQSMNLIRPVNVALRSDHYPNSDANDLDNDQYDLILIDGEPVTDRAVWLRKAPQLIKAGGIIVLDNANRPEYATERLSLQEDAESYVTFDGNEPGTLYLVTEFYRMPK